MIFTRLAAFAVVVVLGMLALALIINASLENKYDERFARLELSQDNQKKSQDSLARRVDSKPWQLHANDTVIFCKVAYPLADRVFRERLQEAVFHFRNLDGWLYDKYQKLGRYQPMIESALLAEGLPTDLEYLFVQESGLDPVIVSWAKAAGLPQFIISTARDFYLAVNSLYDERKNPIKSVKAACKYLKILYSYFDDWPLALASYNHGENAVKAKLKQQGVSDFVDLAVPKETYYYVFRIIALSYIFNRDIMDLRSWLKQMDPLPKSREEYMVIKKPTKLVNLCQDNNLDYDTFKLLNPHLNPVLSPGKYPVNKPIIIAHDNLKELNFHLIPFIPYQASPM
ncbi:MAG: Glycoside hydrolase, family 23 [Parcubacteria group bacterium GW2011_GWD2_43_10]|uniref:Transglycosylase SLT domain-containing protein n=4 Tax=Candidatus Vebleniibacteriota TaxID=1817921 RepID=A0A1G2Q6H0_9BACT|nr:MAG: Glycoside hydrolase, family 23 [Parcubacteria group bacterium GW2011_GWD2_43_10]KKS93740.1 MAG: Glycoside hydrolase, family 23 [Parcubacteria group bacterium GW2011_GWE2_43_12]KKT17861.1 MAG: Glycoside hydrolase, family 23 [Parcubacteria group bacterium GW2011_GWB1_43_66]KKT27945.1 MAG: Glycoside hydrolase, family 23 [Parcubacteria group bacterium GW2011_GWF1_43_9]OHA55947.1 MAG: hypothetical protein A2388_00195 [Candidatus Veblenbacteria bacterium RIFOXYB1_FULL_43_13]OHA56058.1 MAG: h